MSLPWTLEFSTHVTNPSYLLAPVLVFFIGFFEALPTFRLAKVRVPIAFLMMGAALGWVTQILDGGPSSLQDRGRAGCVPAAES